MKAIVNVYLKKNILDPQGVTIGRSLKTMGYDEITSLRMGKRFEIELNTDDKERAMTILKEASDKLLANPVIEDFEVELV